METMEKLLRAFVRTKHFKTTAEVDKTELKRCLTTFDLTALGVGCTLGAGVYVVAGEVARNIAGPAIVISFAIAAVASLLSGLCYAEFGARVPKAGSAYIYSYVTIGELCAFVIGWNMLLEYVFGASAVAKAWSDFFNSLCDGCIREFFVKNLGLGSLKASWMADYPDILAFTFIIVLTIVITCGVAESAAINWVFTILNLAVILFVTAAGLVFADVKNWDHFAPFGFQGVMSGAATCFFAFVGFDVIATSGEECKTPRKSIPRATFAALFIIFVAYECISVTLTLMLPYDKLPKSSALATAFDTKNFPAAKYIVAIGAICGLSSSALDGLFPIPRILYAMASDRLIFSFFGKVYERTGTPVIACVVSGLLTAVLAMFLDLSALAEMLSIGTLLSYTIVSLCVILLRYKPGSVIDESSSESSSSSEKGIAEPVSLEDEQKKRGESENLSKPSDVVTEGEQTASINNEEDDILEELATDDDPLNPNKDFSKTPSILTRVSKRIMGPSLSRPTEDSFLVVKISLAVFISHTIGLQCCLVWGLDRLWSKDPVMIILSVHFLMWILIATDIIARQPESKTKLTFKVPFLPFLPLTAVFVNIFLLLELSYMTWVRFAVWMVLGMTIYLFYGVKHSIQNEDATEHGGPSYIELASSSED